MPGSHHILVSCPSLEVSIELFMLFILSKMPRQYSLFTNIKSKVELRGFLNKSSRTLRESMFCRY